MRIESRKVYYQGFAERVFVRKLELVEHGLERWSGDRLPQEELDRRRAG